MSFDEEFTDDCGIQCPFCGHLLVTEEQANDMTDSRWPGEACDHTLFVFTDSMAFSGFEYRSGCFNAYMDLPDDPDLDVQIPSDENNDEQMPITEVVDRIDLPGFEWTCCGDGFFVVYAGFARLCPKGDGADR